MNFNKIMLSELITRVTTHGTVDAVQRSALIFSSKVPNCFQTCIRAIGTKTSPATPWQDHLPAPSLRMGRRGAETGW